MTDDSPDEIRNRVDEIQRKHRGRIRWRITKHTAEIAIRVIEREPAQPQRSSKSRRRKKHKRML